MNYVIVIEWGVYGANFSFLNKWTGMQLTSFSCTNTFTLINIIFYSVTLTPWDNGLFSEKIHYSKVPGRSLVGAFPFIWYSVFAINMKGLDINMKGHRILIFIAGNFPSAFKWIIQFPLWTFPFGSHLCYYGNWSLLHSRNASWTSTNNRPKISHSWSH